MNLLISFISSIIENSNDNSQLIKFMSNSDYLIKATVKKISERINKTLLEKVEDAANVAQEVPELIKKEIEELKDEIIQEAKRLEEIDSDNNLNNPKSSLNTKIEQSLEKIESIKTKLDSLNDLLEQQKCLNQKYIFT